MHWSYFIIRLDIHFHKTVCYICGLICEYYQHLLFSMILLAWLRYGNGMFPKPASAIHFQVLELRLPTVMDSLEISELSLQTWEFL